MASKRTQDLTRAEVNEEVFRLSREYNKAVNARFIRDVVILIIIAVALAGFAYIFLEANPTKQAYAEALCDLKFGEEYTVSSSFGRTIYCRPKATVGNTGVTITKSGGKLHD